MAASGFTPIQLYRTTTAAAQPSAGNLAAGELAINTTDGKLYYKSTAGSVTLLASAASTTATVSSVDMSVPSFLSVSGNPITSSGTLAVTYSGTPLPIANGGTGSTTLGGANIGLTNAINTWSSNQTFSGGIDVSSGLSYIGPSKQKIVSQTASTATTTLDLSSADVFLLTIAASTTLVFSNPPVDGTMKSFNIIMQNNSTGGYAVSFPGSVSWAGGQLPPRTTTANAKDFWSFFTPDGSAYAGSLSIQNY